MKNLNLNSRVKFAKGKQRRFINNVLSLAGLSKLAESCGVCDRTLRDWRREKFTMRLGSLETICKKIDINIPKDIKILPPYWSIKKASRLGGLRYVELYGSPGTLESRRKGGENSQKKFRENPQHAEKMKFVLRKKIKYPAKSELLAEFTGIMLGDGGISSPYQITISFDGQRDYKYAIYIQRVIKNLFGIFSTLAIRKKHGRADVVVSGINLVEFLEKIGIKRGNKVINQIDIPNWIFERKEYQIGCLRGLFDTDGCIYKHKYKVSGKLYSYTKMSFRNYSFPLLRDIEKMLKNLGFKAKININQKAVLLHRSSEVKKYFSLINTRNPRYLGRYLQFFSEKTGQSGEVA